MALTPNIYIKCVCSIYLFLFYSKRGIKKQIHSQSKSLFFLSFRLGIYWFGKGPLQQQQVIHVQLQRQWIFFLFQSKIDYSLEPKIESDDAYLVLLDKIGCLFLFSFVYFRIFHSQQTYVTVVAVQARVSQKSEYSCFVLQCRFFYIIKKFAFWFISKTIMMIHYTTAIMMMMMMMKTFFPSRSLVFSIIMIFINHYHHYGEH